METDPGATAPMNGVSIRRYPNCEIRTSAQVWRVVPGKL
jgi:hypothetical protein